MHGAGAGDLRRSNRANKGEGGVVQQMTKIANVIERKPKEPKERVQGVPLSQKVNPMAPIVQVLPRRRKSQTAPTIPEPAEFVQPQFLVPPGTEPKLPGAFNHQFGFRPPVTGVL